MTQREVFFQCVEVEHKLLDIKQHVLCVAVHLEGITWDCSKERRELVPLNQTGAGVNIADLPKTQHICSIIHHIVLRNVHNLQGILADALIKRK